MHFGKAMSQAQALLRGAGREERNHHGFRLLGWVDVARPEIKAPWEPLSLVSKPPLAGGHHVDLKDEVPRVSRKQSPRRLTRIPVPYFMHLDCGAFNDP